MKKLVVRIVAFTTIGLAAISAIDADALALTGVKSRKVHNAAGSFDLPIDTTQSLTASVTVEPRALGAGHVIVFQFDDIITSPGTASAVDPFGPIGTVSMPVITGTGNNEVSVTLTGIPDNKRVMISLTQVNGIVGGLGDFAASMGFLVGDVDGTRVVSPVDISRIKARSGQSTTGASFVYDLNATGAINSSDISTAKARSGLALVSASEVSLFVTKPGSGLGTITSTPTGINCGGTCAANFPQNTSVTVSAAPTVGSVFTGWSGACTGVATTSVFTLVANAICNANFTVNTYAVTPSAVGSGTITPSTMQMINHGQSGVFTVTPSGGFTVSVGGTCGGNLFGGTYTTSPITTPCSVVATFVPTAMPIVLYTDIVSGPTTGGENNKGIYLSIFGKNFGSSGLGIGTKVFINNVEVDNYRYLGASKGRPDIQQITVQVGAIGNPTPLTPLPIKVSVGSLDSNTDQTFTAVPGNIYFVNNVVGVDTTGTSTGGTFAAPFKTVQKSAGKSLNFTIDPASVAGAWGRVRAGDFIVIRGTGTPYTTNQTTGNNVGFDGYFVRALNKSGCAIGTLCAQGGGTTSGPITLMGYPTENVFINDPYVSTGSGAISSASTARIQEGKGHWINIVNLRVESGNSNGAVNTQAGGSNWRIVNNELTCADAVNSPGAFAGGIAGNASAAALAPGPSQGSFYLGNYIHDVYDGPDDGTHPMQNHGVYVDGSGSYDIGYNRIENIRGGNGLQTYTDGTNGSPFVDGVSFHHNVISNVAKHGINIADQSRSNIKVWNNIVYNIDQAGLRFNTIDLVDAKFYNNTFYNTNRSNFSGLGAIQNDNNFVLPNAVDIRNNIFIPVTGDYESGGVFRGTVTNNLWFNGTGPNPASSFSTNSLTTNPLFVSVAASNFRLSTGSPAINSGTSAVAAIVIDDFDIVSPTTFSRTLRPQGAAYDIGAYEFTLH